MAPAVSFQPWYSCASFPLCQNSQTRKRSGPAGSRQRSEYCDLCISSQLACVIYNCSRRAAPTTGRYTTDLCVIHYRDPLNATRRQWDLCCNSRIGCRHLSQTPRSGKCFACPAGNVPCAYSLAGCTAHTRSTNLPLSQRLWCAPARSGKCSFDPKASSTCSTPFCGQPRASLPVSFCSDCSSGVFPCSRLCSRRCNPSSPEPEHLCDLCAASTHPQGSSPAGSADVGGASVTAPAVSSITSSHHLPKYACLNFPFCRKSQKQIFACRSKGHAQEKRERYCGSCIKALELGKLCSHSGCGHPPAPRQGGKDSNGLCSWHVKDPAYASMRAWPLCRNKEDIVFRYRSFFH